MKNTIKVERAKKDMTQQDLAEKVSVSSDNQLHKSW